MGEPESNKRSTRKIISISMQSIILKMKYFVKAVVVIVATSISCFAFSQSDTATPDLSIERNKTIRQLLDYRFRGGSGEFERLLLQKVSYSQEALTHCVMGTVILSFTVDCDNKMSEMRMRNPMYYGLNEQLQAFYKSTEGNWNSCNDNRYTRFEIPILFSIENVETRASGLMVVEGKSQSAPMPRRCLLFGTIQKVSKQRQNKKGTTDLRHPHPPRPIQSRILRHEKSLVGGRRNTLNMESLLRLDKALFLLLNDLHHPWLDPVMVHVSGKLEWLPLYLVLLFLVVRHYKWESVRLLFSIPANCPVRPIVRTTFQRSFHASKAMP